MEMREVEEVREKFGTIQRERRERGGKREKKDFFSSKVCDSQYKKKSIRYYIESRRLEEFWTG